MKRVPLMTKPTGRVPKSIGAILLKEVPYQNEWRIQATWRDPDRKKKWFNNWRHAEEFAAKENRRLDELKEKGAGRFTFNDAAESFRKRCEQRTKSKDRTLGLETFQRYDQLVEMLQHKFGKQKLHAISCREIEDWFHELSGKYAASTLRGMLMMLSVVLDHAVIRGMLNANPLRAQKVKLPGKIKKRAEIPDRSDLETLRKYLNQPKPIFNNGLKWSCLKVLVLLGASCGMRAGEVVALRWDSIDRETGEIDIKESIGKLTGRKPPKSEAGYRKIPTTLRAQEILERHAIFYKQTEGRCVGPVLKIRGGKPLDPRMVSLWFTEVMSECGLIKPDTKRPKFTFHALRHWCASHWMKATNGDVHQVAKWLGHKNASMTLDVYGHCLDDPEAREKFLRIPDWLDPIVEIDAPSRPLTIPPPIALPAPEETAIKSNVAVPVVDVELPIDVPSMARPWVEQFLKMLFRGTGPIEAYSLIEFENGRQSISSAQHKMLDEFKRLGLPSPRTLYFRWRDERILRLYEQGHQVLEIARMTDCTDGHVYAVLKSRHKVAPLKLLKHKYKRGPTKFKEPQSEHKPQLKLL
jgi:integrase